MSDLLGRYEHFFDETVFRPEDANRIFRIACVDNALYTFLSPAISQLLERAPSIGIEIKPIKADFCESADRRRHRFCGLSDGAPRRRTFTIWSSPATFSCWCGQGNLGEALAKGGAL